MLSTPAADVLLVCLSRRAISCFDTGSKVSLISFVQWVWKPSGRRVQVATVAGENESRMITHFPWNILFPCISGTLNSYFILLVFNSLKA